MDWNGFDFAAERKEEIPYHVFTLNSLINRPIVRAIDYFLSQKLITIISYKVKISIPH